MNAAPRRTTRSASRQNSVSTADNYRAAPGNSQRPGQSVIFAGHAESPNMVEQVIQSDGEDEGTGDQMGIRAIPVSSGQADLRGVIMVGLLVFSLVFFAVFFPRVRREGISYPDPNVLIGRYTQTCVGGLRSAASFPSRLSSAIRLRSLRQSSAWETPLDAASIDGRLQTDSPLDWLRSGTGKDAATGSAGSSLSQPTGKLLSALQSAREANAQLFETAYYYAAVVPVQTVSKGYESLQKRVIGRGTSTTGGATGKSMESGPTLSPGEMRAAMESQVREIVRDEVKRASQASRSQSATSAETLAQFADELVERIAADKNDRPDLALLSAGAKLVSSSPSPLGQYSRYLYDRYLGLVGFRSSIAAAPRAPGVALAPGVQPGQCWAFAGQQANLTVQLIRTAIVGQVVVEHAPAASVLNMDSAPKQFKVYGSRRGERFETELGSFKYQIGLGHLHMQFFAVVNDRPVDTVRLSILSNQGSSPYTCLYRFRVHGLQAPF